MILSMTGYGRAESGFQGKTITVEARSLNGKNTDIRVRLPQIYREKEMDIRNTIKEKALRGKVEVNIEIQEAAGDGSYGINRSAFLSLYRDLDALSQELNLSKGDFLSSILRVPGVVDVAGGGITDEEWDILKGTLVTALANMTKYRSTEGGAMETDFRERVASIENLLAGLEPYEKERVNKIRQRLDNHMREFLNKDQVDENRFEQEILFYLEKIDINEEKVRLKQHCRYFLEQIDSKSSQKGRKLNFIAQEMGREINTIGSKAYSSDIQRIVVQMKDDLEKIKEQAANVL